MYDIVSMYIHTVPDNIKFAIVVCKKITDGLKKKRGSGLISTNMQTFHLTDY